ETIAELNAPLPRSLAPHEPISPPDRRGRRRSLAEKAGPGDAVVAVRPGMGSEVILADTNAEDLPPTGSVLRPALIGIGAVAIFFIGFGSWAATSSLDRAVVASGQVTVERGRRELQHLDGGIVKELLVEEGQLVTEGEVVLQLDETSIRSSVEVLRGRLRAARARQSRLLAEQSGAAEIDFPEEITDHLDDPAV